MSDNMRREFKSRDQMVAYLCEQFPAAARRDDHISEIVGGQLREGTANGRCSKLCKITQFHWCRDPSITIHPMEF